MREVPTDVTPTSSTPLTTRFLLLASTGLVLFIVGLYARTYSYPFLRYGDSIRIPESAKGENVSFTQLWERSADGTWQPLTKLSHQLDVSILGSNAGRHRMENVILHGIAASLVFVFFSLWTHRPILSLVVASIFALHPLQAGTVIWIAQRQVLLGSSLALLSLICYLRFARSRSSNFYAAAVLTSALACLSHPFAFVLPILFLTIDFTESATEEFWPNFQPFLTKKLVEKIPFFVISLATCWAIYRRWSLVPDAPALEASLLAGMSACGRGLLVSVAPISVAIYEPDLPTRNLPLALSITGLALLALILTALWKRKDVPWVGVGLGWFLCLWIGSLVALPIGDPSFAASTFYLAMVGLILVIASLVSDFADRRGMPWLLPALGIVAALALSWRTWNESSYWRSTTDIFERALVLTKQNPFAHRQLLAEYTKEQNWDAATKHAKSLIALKQDDGELHAKLAELLMLTNHSALDVLAEFDKAVSYAPSSSMVRGERGLARAKFGKLNEAISDLEQAIAIDPAGSKFRFVLADLLQGTRRTDAAIAQYQKGLEIDPANLSGLNGLGMIYAQRGRMKEAAELFERAHQADPNDAGSGSNLGLTLSRVGKPDEAVTILQNVIKQHPDFRQAKANLADVFKRQSKWSQSRELYESLAVGYDWPTEAHLAIVELYIADGKIKEALDLIKSWREKHPDDLVLSRLLANALTLNGSAEESIRIYEEVLAKSPLDVQSLNNLAWIRATHADKKLRDPAKAINFAERLARHPEARQNASLWDTIASAYASSGDFKRALAALDNADLIVKRTGMKSLAEVLTKRRELFVRNTPYVEPATSPKAAPNP